MNKTGPGGIRVTCSSIALDQAGVRVQSERNKSAWARAGIESDRARLASSPKSTVRTSVSSESAPTSDGVISEKRPR